MNKIYKVIWNKAKGCYQVASEFAHQQGRGGSTKSAVKHTAAVLTVMALLGGISGMHIVSAADQGDTVTAGQATIKGDTNNNFVVSGHGGGAVDDVTSAGNSIIISALGDTQNNGTPTTVKNTNETIAIGNGIQATVNDDIKSDKYYYLYHANTVIGTHAKSIDSGEGVALGSESSLKNVKMGVAIGYGASVSNSTYQKNEYGKIAGMALGYHANVTNAQGGIAIGAQTTATADGSVALGSGSLAAEEDTVSVGNVGGGYYRRIVNVEGGRFTEGSHDAVTAGQLYAAGMVPGTIEAKQGDTATNSIAMGEKSKVTGNNSIAIGGQALSSADVVMGQDATATSVNATAIGNNSHATASQATALGQNAWAQAEGAVALGNNSVANEKNTVSVGNKGSERKIVNVKDGTVAENSKDAVTGGQLYSVKEDVDAINNSAVKYDNADKTSVTFGGKNGTALNNVSEISGTNNTFHVDQNGHARFNNIMITDNNAVMGPHGNNIKVLLDDKSSRINGVTFQDGKVSGVADGDVSEKSTDAVNGSQLYEVSNKVTSLDNDSVKWDKDEKGNVTNAIKGVSFDGDGAFSTTVNRSMFGGTNTLSFNDQGLTISGTNDDGTAYGTTNILGGTITTNKVTGLANGEVAENSKDAVNGGQLFDVKNSVDGLNNLAVKYDNADKNSVTFGGTNGTALKNVSEINGTGDAFHIDQYGHARFNDIMITDGNATMGPNSNNVKVLLDDQHSYINGVSFVDGKVSGVADGDVSEKSTDAVNGSQLFDVKNSVDGLNNLAVKYDNADKTSVTFGGTNGTALKNVSDIYSSTGKGHIYFYGDNVHIGADNSNKGVNVTTDGAAVQGNLNVTGNFSVGDDPKSGTGFAFDQNNGLSSAFYGSTTKDGITERNQSFLKQNDDGITLSYKHQTDSDATGNITDADNTFTFGKAGVKLSGKDGAALKITGVAKGTDATDAVNKEQLDEVSNKVTSLDNDSVKWDKDANGNVTNAIKGVSFEGEGKLKANKITGLQDAELDETKDGYDASAAVNVGTLKTAVSSMTGMNSNLGNVVQYQKDGSLLVSKGQNALGVDNNGARLVSSNEQNGVGSTASVATSDGSASMTVTNVNSDGSTTTSGFTANKDGSNTIDGNTNINGNLNVNGNFSVNGKDIVTTDDLDKVSGTLNDLDKYAGDKSKLNVTDKDGNKVTNLTDAVNANSDKIAATNKVIGATGEKGALKLTNGATTIESGINQNTAAIQQNSEAINSLGRGLNHLGQEVDNVGAISAALAGLHPLGYDGDGSKFQIAAAVGTYDGTQAAALGGFYHFNRDVMMSLGASSSFGSDNKTAANLGVTFRVGQGSGNRKIADSSTMDTILQRLEKLDKEVAGLKEENKKLTQENEQQKQELEALKR